MEERVHTGGTVSFVHKKREDISQGDISMIEDMNEGLRIEKRKRKVKKIIFSVVVVAILIAILVKVF